MMKKILFVFILILIVSQAFSAHIEYLNKDNKFKIFNKNSGVILSYYKVNPGEKLEAKLYGVDQISVITRVLNVETTDSYTYNLEFDGTSRDIIKNPKPSSVSKGLKGEVVSTYNKYVTNLNSYTTKLQFTNTSSVQLIVKLNGNNVISDRKDIEFVNYTPSKFESEKTLILDDKEYTYYTSNGKKVELILEGPATLKIMSRLIFEYNYVNSLAYRYNVYDNGKMHSSFSDKAYKSSSAFVKELPEMIPSYGDKNIIKFPAGMHKVVVEDGDVNRDLMFRFYLTKSAIGVRE